MGLHPWPGIDPASAYTTMTGGAWAAPMHAAGTALDVLGGQVHVTVAVSEVNDTIVGENWSGQGRIKAAASVTNLNTDQLDYGSLSLLKSEILHSAGELHTTTVPQMVTHIQANANRGEWGIDNAINPWVLGMLTPRLIDLDTEYFGFMWPNNASAGLRYGAGLDALGAALAGLSALPSIAGGSVAAPAMAAADVASNAGMSMMSAVMSATEQAATSAISPATSGASHGGSTLTVQSQLSAPNTSTSMSGISPMAAVQSRGPVSPALAQSQPPAMGMFAPPAAAALTPSAPSPAMPSSPPVQTMAPSAAPGVTSFAKPTEPFSPPPPSGGKAVGLKPGMLNASALRGPVGTAPASTALLTKPLTTASSLATEPLAYVTPDVPRPISSAPPPHPLLTDPGSIQTLNPPPAPPAQPSPPAAPPPANPQSPPQSAPPAPSDGPEPGPGTGGPGPGVFQMLGNGLGGAPQAPQFPMPLDPVTPAQIAEMDASEVRAEIERFNADQTLWNSQCGGKTLPPGPYSACMSRLSGLDARRAALIARAEQLGIPLQELAPGETSPPASVPGQAQTPSQTTGPAPPTSEQTTPPPSQETQAPQAPKEEPSFPPPTEIRGFRDHGLEQVTGRDGGVGVNQAALQDAVEHPLSPPVFRPDQYGGTYTYIGKNARVSLNSAGEVVTAWATNHEGWLNP
jgi:hypothetical protein